MHYIHVRKSWRTEMEDKKYFGITTPLYYANDIPHIGHAYSTIVVDSIARFHRQLGEEVQFITGSDEHGLKIFRAAQQAGKKPIERADEVVEYTKKLWKKLEISYDRFVRTTEPKHYQDVQKVVKKIFDNGDIYKDIYEGWYCTPCETFLTDEEAGDEKICPECGRKVEWQKEDTFKFRLSRYQEPLVKLYEKQPWRIHPDSRYNEIMSRLRNEPLNDLSITRTSLEWGVPLPDIAKGHVCYVWFDALLGYATAAGIFGDPNLPKGHFEKIWPHTIHIIGKDILWFHTVIWPAMQLALGFSENEISAGTFAHGFWIEKGEKMSKSKGNIVDPVPLIDDFGTDSLRYFLLREITFGLDGNISLESIISRINSDLANDLGNLLHRSLSMLQQTRNGVIPAPDAITIEVPQVTYSQLIEHFNSCLTGDPQTARWGLPSEVLIDFDENGNPVAQLEIHRVEHVDFHYALWIENLAQQVFRSYFGLIRRMLCLEIKEALIEVWNLIKLANKYIDETEPWALAKKGEDRILDSVFYYLFEAIRSSALMLSPFVPGISRSIYEQLGIKRDVECEPLENTIRWGAGLIPPGTVTSEPKPLVPRIDAVEYLKKYEENLSKAKSTQKGDVKTESAKPVVTVTKPEITYEDFTKIDLRVAHVIKAEKVEGADKLLKLELDLGFEKRQIVAGVAKQYKPEDILGKKIVIVANLAPRKLRGIESKGMLLAATSGEDIILVVLDRDATPGSTIS